mgnify:CR=1 FL=1
MILMPFMPSAAFTSLSLKPSTLRRLRAYKVAGMSYDDVLNDLMDEQPTAAFWKEHERRLREEDSIPWEEVKERLRKRRAAESRSDAAH